jgi:EAL domain-containing protein (putative c-di-GMP-specific phosphodiesterase class I)
VSALSNDRGRGGDASAHASELCELELAYEGVLSGLTSHFQPIVYARDRRRFGYEALMRSSSRTLPHPGAILDAAERLERVTALGRANRALVADIIARAPVERGVFFVNLHLQDVFDRSLVSPFAPLSKVATRVVLEITERSSLDGAADLRYRVTELRELGFRIAIDDLGGGHARMGAMALTDTDFVKLDMSLVRDVHQHPVKRRLVASIVQVCADQGIQVIGEGVETQGEAEVLQDVGCHLLQGYLIARPAAAYCDAL